MNITINVDETQFKEILDRELKDLPKEDLQEIIKQALTQYIMSNPELVKNLLITNRISRYSNEYTPTPIMEDIVKAKFSQNEELAEKLLATDDEYLIEGNTWGDRFWGAVNGEGRNQLGIILMQVRNELRAERSQT